MDIRDINIQELNAAHYNPRKDLQPGDAEYIKLYNSIEEFGYIDPIIWNEVTGRVVGGHQRLKILQAKGLTTVKVSVVNLTEEKEKALNVALNKISGDWDEAKLAALLYGMDFDAQELTGFDQDEIDDIIAEYIDAEQEEAEDDDFDLDAGIDNARDTTIREGDIIGLGRHRLICGDSTDPKTFEKLLGGVVADFILTDPPYNVGYVGKTQEELTIENDDMSDEGFCDFLYRAFTNTFNHTKEGGNLS